MIGYYEDIFIQIFKKLMVTEQVRILQVSKLYYTWSKLKLFILAQHHNEQQQECESIVTTHDIRGISTLDIITGNMSNYIKLSDTDYIRALDYVLVFEHRFRPDYPTNKRQKFKISFNTNINNTYIVGTRFYFRERLKSYVYRWPIYKVRCCLYPKSINDYDYIEYYWTINKLQQLLTLLKSKIAYPTRYD